MTSGQQSPHVSLIGHDRMETMGKNLIQLCDQLEQHGLVDYQMGIWEEEILSGKFGIQLPIAFVLCFIFIWLTLA
jgi:hypothetical protein